VPVRTTSLLSLPSLLRTLLAHVRLSVRLLRDPAVPLLLKLLPFAALAYLVSPVDGVPDFIPVLGQLDDLGVLMLALESFLRLSPERVVQFHRTAMAHSRGYSPAPGGAGAEVVDAEFRHHDDRL
jgi:uncharacterized membrane protein YkvA (DUF1232 family)